MVCGRMYDLRGIVRLSLRYDHCPYQSDANANACLRMAFDAGDHMDCCYIILATKGLRADASAGWQPGNVVIRCCDHGHQPDTITILGRLDNAIDAAKTVENRSHRQYSVRNRNSRRFDCFQRLVHQRTTHDREMDVGQRNSYSMGIRVTGYNNCSRTPQEDNLQACLSIAGSVILSFPVSTRPAKRSSKLEPLMRSVESYQPLLDAGSSIEVDTTVFLPRPIVCFS